MPYPPPTGGPCQSREISARHRKILELRIGVLVIATKKGNAGVNVHDGDVLPVCVPMDRVAKERWRQCRVDVHPTETRIEIHALGLRKAMANCFGLDSQT